MKSFSRSYRGVPYLSYGYGRQGYKKRKVSRKINRIRNKRARAVALSRKNPYLRTGGFSNIELKFYDTFFATDEVATTWTGGEIDPLTKLNLCSPQNGTGESNRDGKNFTIKHLMIKGQVNYEWTNDQPDLSNGGLVMIKVVLDTQTNGAQCQGEDIMDDSQDPKALAFRNLDYRTRFKILASRTVSIVPTVAFPDGSNTGTVTGQAKPFSVYLKNLNIGVSTNGNAGTIADIMDNSLHVIACATNAGFNVMYKSRARFIG